MFPLRSYEWMGATARARRSAASAMPIGGPPAERSALCRLLVESLLRLSGTADVHGGQTELQADQRVRARVPTPCDPQHVAQQEDPEADVATRFAVRRNEPRREHGDDHCGPLEKIEKVHCR